MSVDMNLSIVSFNIKGLKPRNYDYLQILFHKFDFLLIQETWLFDFEYENISKILPKSSFIGKSAMNENEIGRLGRPFGGCMILYKNSCLLPVSQVHTNSARLCGATIVTKSFRILLISLYMPCDENTNNSASDYIDVLNEMSALFNTYDGFKIIVGGDFNVDFVRNSFNTKLLIDFMDSESLININSVFKNNEYTFESYNGSRSLVDYFMITENGKNNVLSYEVLDDGLNMSDHRPIVIKLNFSHSNAVEKF